MDEMREAVIVAYGRSGIGRAAKGSLAAVSPSHFAAQAIPCIRQLNLDVNKVNPRGGAVAMGHPLGATGAILVIKAISYMQDNGGKDALVSMCINFIGAVVAMLMACVMYPV